MSHQVLVVDWDVHHGNGTQNMFLDDPKVMYFSAHRFDSGYFYPGASGSASIVGEGPGVGKNINVGWDTEINDRGAHVAMGDAEYAAAWQHVLMPLAREVRAAVPHQGGTSTMR